MQHSRCRAARGVLGSVVTVSTRQPPRNLGGSRNGLMLFGTVAIAAFGWNSAAWPHGQSRHGDPLVTSGSGVPDRPAPAERLRESVSVGDVAATHGSTTVRTVSRRPVFRRRRQRVAAAERKTWFLTIDFVRVLAPDNQKEAHGPALVIDSIDADQRSVALASGRVCPATATANRLPALTRAPEKIRSVSEELFDSHGSMPASPYASIAFRPAISIRVRQHMVLSSERGRAVWTFTLSVSTKDVCARVRLAGAARRRRGDACAPGAGRFSASCRAHARRSRGHDTLRKPLVVLFASTRLLRDRRVPGSRRRAARFGLRHQVEFSSEARVFTRDLRIADLGNQRPATAMPRSGDSLTSELSVAFHLDAAGAPRADLHASTSTPTIGQIELRPPCSRSGRNVGVDLRYHRFRSTPCRDNGSVFALVCGGGDGDSLGLKR